MKKILLIDGNGTGIEKFISRILEKTSFSLLHTKSGAKGVDIFQKNKKNIFIILLATEIQDMSAREVCETISKNGGDVVIFSGHLKNNPKIKNLLESGADDYLAKPISRDNLLSFLEYKLLVTENTK